MDGNYIFVTKAMSLFMDMDKMVGKDFEQGLLNLNSVAQRKRWLSGQVTETVPAKVKLVRVVPRRVAWGGTVRITGQLVGGYLPSGGALVRLRIGLGRRRRPTASRSTSRAAAGSQPPTRSELETRASTAHTGSSSPRCRWATIRSRPRTPASGSCASAGIRRSAGPITATNTEDTIGVPVRADDRQRGWRILQSHGDRHGSARVPLARLRPQAMALIAISSWGGS